MSSKIIFGVFFFLDFGIMDKGMDLSPESLKNVQDLLVSVVYLIQMEDIWDCCSQNPYYAGMSLDAKY